MTDQIDHEAQGARNKRAGKRAQKEFAQLMLRLWGINWRLHSWRHVIYTAHHPDNTYMKCPGEGYHVEIKAERDLRVHDAIRQAIGDAHGGLWFTAIKRPPRLRKHVHSLWLVAVPLPIFTDVRTRAGTDFQFVCCHNHASAGRWNWTRWIRDIEAEFDPGKHEFWTIIIGDHKDPDEPMYAFLPAVPWAGLLLHAWNNREVGTDA